MQVTSEAKKKRERENDRLAKSANYSTKVMWQLINKHVGKLHISNQDIDLKTKNPQTIAYTMNSFYID